MEGGEQGGGDDVRERALVLLGGPIQFIGADGFEFVELGVEDAQVQVVAQVDPGDNEEAEVGPDKGMIEVVEGF